MSTPRSRARRSRSTACSRITARRAAGRLGGEQLVLGVVHDRLEEAVDAGSPRISLMGSPAAGVRRNVWASAPSVSAHAADSSSSSTTCRPIGETTPDCTETGSTGTQPPACSSSRSSPRSSRQPSQGCRVFVDQPGIVGGSTPALTISRKMSPAGPARSARRSGPWSMFMGCIMTNAQDPRPDGRGSGDADVWTVCQTPRRALSPSSSVQSTAGRCSPNFSNHSVICGISAFHSSTSTSRACREVLLGHVEPVDVEGAGRGDVADRRLDRGGLALDPLDDPLQDPAVLAEAWPQEATVVVAAEPVDVEDARHLRRVVLLAHLDPVVEVVAGVVADERQHRHRVAADDADLAGGGGGRLAREGRAHEGAVHPVARLGHQRDRGLAPTTEEDRVDRHTARVVVLRGEDRALLDRRAVAAVRVAGAARRTRASRARPSTRWRGPGVFSRPSHQTSPSSVSATLVNTELPMLMVSIALRVGVLVGAGGDAEEAVLRVDRPQPAVLADAHPGDVVADGLDLPARDGGLEHREVGLAAGAREGGGDVLRDALRGWSA